jgi:hypothetical protein
MQVRSAQSMHALERVRAELKKHYRYQHVVRITPGWHKPCSALTNLISIKLAASKDGLREENSEEG